MPPGARNPTVATVFALLAIALWGSLARLAVMAQPMPPFLLAGLALLVAGVLSLPFSWRSWRVAPSALALGVYGLFGFHLFLFLALSLAPPLPANLINYLWPLLLVLLAPLVLGGERLSLTHVMAAIIGFAGAALAIASGAKSQGDTSAGGVGLGALAGYACAAISALIWATYSLFSQRIQATPQRFGTGAIGLFCLVSGTLALGCHALFETGYVLRAFDVWILIALGAGPMGAAFFLWDAALKRGDATKIGALAYLTPLLSTALLAIGKSAADWRLPVAAVLIVGAAVIGQMQRRLGPGV
jgi:drug/metabolite transporter (DMT)-like permease